MVRCATYMHAFLMCNELSTQQARKCHRLPTTTGILRGPRPSSAVSSKAGQSLRPPRAWAPAWALAGAEGFSSHCPKPPTSSNPSSRLRMALPSLTGIYQSLFTPSLCWERSCLLLKSPSSRLRIRGCLGGTLFSCKLCPPWAGVTHCITTPVALGGSQ